MCSASTGPAGEEGSRLEAGMQILRWNRSFEVVLDAFADASAKDLGMGGMGEPWVVECRQVRARGLFSGVMW